MIDMLKLNAMIGIIIYEKWFWTEMICQPKIYFPLVGENGDLCFNDLNNSKLNHIQKMPTLNFFYNGVSQTYEQFCFKY